MKIYDGKLKLKMHFPLKVLTLVKAMFEGKIIKSITQTSGNGKVTKTIKNFKSDEYIKGYQASYDGNEIDCVVDEKFENFIFLRGVNEFEI